MTGDPEFDRLVALLPQVRQCAKCGAFSPFVRAIWSFQEGTTGVVSVVCFWCAPPTLGELRQMGNYAADFLPPDVLAQQARNFAEIGRWTLRGELCDWQP